MNSIGGATATTGSQASMSTSSTQASGASKASSSPTVSFRSVLAASGTPSQDAGPGGAGQTGLLDDAGLPLSPWPGSTGSWMPYPGMASGGLVPPSMLPPDTAADMAQPPDGKMGAHLLSRDREDDALDAMRHRHAPSTTFEVGTVQAPAASAPQPAAVEAVRAQTSVEDLLPAYVRKIQWGGDGRKGTVRMEVARGELAGSTITIHADSGRVRVHLDVPPGVDPKGWEGRIRGRLAAKNIPTDSVEVT